MISIIVPCKNRIDQLSECLNSILLAVKKAKKDIPNLDVETIVVNDHSESGFVEKVNEMFSEILVINSIGVGPGAARNYGIEKSKGDYLFFTDSDCVVDEDWVICGYKTFLKEKPIVIQGIPWLFQKNVNKYLGECEEKLYEIMFSTYVNGNFSTMTDSRNLLFDKKIVEKIGKEVFSEKIDKATAESRVFGQRCNNNGISVYFDRNVKVFHEDSKDMMGVCKQKYRHGMGRVLIWNEKPDYEYLKNRYYDNPINKGIDKDYILPAHTSFLLGYYKNLGDKEEYNKFLKFCTNSLNEYGRKVEDYKEVLELMKND